nr:hypothetical protein [Tanacetum cinerariifolium]
VFTPEPIPTKIDFVKAGEFIKHVKPVESIKLVKPVTPVKTAEQTEKSKNFSSSPKVDRKNWNGKMTQKLGLGFRFTKKSCFVCGSLSHLIKDCTFHEDRMAKKSVLPTNVGKGTGHRESRPGYNNIQIISHQNKFAPTAVFIRFGRIPVSAAKPKAVASTSAAKPVNTAGPKQSGHPQQAIKNKGIVDNGCSRHMTGNIAYLADYQEIHDGGFVAFARTMLADSLLPITFWAEAVNTACNVLNRALVTKTHNNTPYELLNGRSPRLDFVRPFGCPDTILNTLDPLRKFEGKADEGFLVGYSVTSKAFRVFNAKTKKVEENLHVSAYDDLDIYTSLFQCVGAEADFNNMESSNIVSPIPTHKVHIDHPKDQILGNPKSAVQTKGMTKKSSRAHALKVWRLVDLPYGKKAIGTKWVYKNKKDERRIVFRNKARQVAQGHRQEKGIEYDEQKRGAFLYGAIEEEVYVSQPPSFIDPQFSNKVYKVEKALYGLHQTLRPCAYDDLDIYTSLFQCVGAEADFNNMESSNIVSPIPTHKVHIDHPKDQILGNPKSAVQTKGMTKKSSRAHALFPNKVYKVEKALYGLHQAPRAWCILMILSLDPLKSLCDEFEALMHKRFQMSSMGVLTFFLGLQVKQSEEGIFISQDKYVAEILKFFYFSSVKTASTPIETQKPLVKDEKATDVDVHLYRSMIRSLMYLTASRPDIMFAVCACSRFQVTSNLSQLHVVKRIFRYLKSQSKLGLWYPRDSPFDLEANSDNDYAGANLDTKSTIGCCQFLDRRLISWQCKKQTIVATSTT